MKRAILYTFALAALCGCVEEPAGTQIVEPTDELTPITYGVTRAKGENAPPPPPEDQVFTFISYPLSSGTAGIVTNYYPNAAMGYNKHQGYYTYLPDEDVWGGVMQPCSIEAPNTRWSSTERDPQQGQALANRQYMSVCLHPAVELFNNGAGSERMLFTRRDVRYASAPFAINVQGYQVFALPEPYDDGTTLPLRDLRSKVWFEVIQGTDREFRITEPKLINAGFWGWYHPLLETTQISYERGSRYDSGSNEFHDETLDQPGDDSSVTTPKTGRYRIYDKADPVFQSETSEEALTIVPDAAPNDGSGLPDTFYGPATYGKGNTIYETGRNFEQGIFFFANNYRTSTDYLQPGIYFELEMGEGDEVSNFKINIPFDIDMEPNHAYLFRLTVESAAIRVHFRPAPWEGVHANGGDIGGDDTPWTLLGTWESAGWIDEEMNNGDDNIGDE